LAFDRYAYANNNPIKFTDPSGHSSDWVDFLQGAAYQYANDMTHGFVEDVAHYYGVCMDCNASDAYKNGQKAGRVASVIVASTESVVGTYVAAVSAAAMVPTLTGGAVCTAATFGACAAAAAPAVAVEAAGVVAGTAATVHGVATMAYIKNNPCPGCQTSNPQLNRSRGAIARRQHVEDPQDIGKDGVSAWCPECNSGPGKFWGRTVDEIRSFAESIGLDPNKAVKYTPEFGGGREGHYSLFIDAIGSDGYLMPKYADAIDSFLRAGAKLKR
jgi:hypothetical protein